MLKYLLISCFFLFVHLKIRETKGKKLDLAYDIYFPSSEEESDLPPIVLIHAFLDSKNTWKYVAQPLADKTGRTIYAYDVRNHGDSPWTSDFNIEILVGDLKNFLALHNISEAILVGHSLGGRTAQTLALTEPEKVEMLIVEEMGMADLTSLPDIATGFLIRVLRKSLTVIPPDADEETALEALMNFIWKVLPGSFAPKRAFDDITLPVKIVEGNITWKANLDVLEKSYRDGKLGNNLTGTYEEDALYIYGTKSIARIDQEKDLIKEHFPRAQLLGFVGGNHLVHHEYPEDFVREIVRFITGFISPESTCWSASEIEK
ncbi:protein ABHD11-like [Uloborus diversus]|uniref:protein ABHD11-like n=1 Tax=Uloborus diversus TaxID=327109 RepID=UPI0024097CDA|nr:protein ABHD11-like [Uloborus diversus]